MEQSSSSLSVNEFRVWFLMKILQKENKTICSLGSFVPFKVVQIAEHLSLTRQSTYDIIKRLSEKKYVEYCPKTNKNKGYFKVIR